MYGIVLVLQLVVGLIMGLYFMRQLKRQKQSEGGSKHESHQEMETLRRLRSIHLNVPLNEQVRPKAFSDIIGQEEGIAALQAVLCGPNPQHVIIYGPPGVGKTCAARLVLEEASAGGIALFARTRPSSRWTPPAPALTSAPSPIP